MPIRGVARAAAAIDSRRERALRTRALATVRRDLPGVRADLRQLAYRGADRDRVEDRFAELDWGQITTRIPRWASA